MAGRGKKMWHGGSLVELPPLWSPDGRLLLVAAGVRVDVCCARTGERRRALCGHRGVVTALCLSASNAAQCLTASADGTIRAWDYRDGALLRCGRGRREKVRGNNSERSAAPASKQAGRRRLNAVPPMTTTTLYHSCVSAEPSFLDDAYNLIFSPRLFYRNACDAHLPLPLSQRSDGFAFHAHFAAFVGRTVSVGLPIVAMALPPPGSPAKAAQCAYVSVRWLKAGSAGGEAAAAEGGKGSKAKKGGQGPSAADKEAAVDAGAVALSQLAASASSSGRVLQIDLATGGPRRVLLKVRGEPPHALQVSPRGGFLGALSRRRVTLWRLPDATKFTLRHTKELTALAFDHADERLAVGDRTGRILLWHALRQASAAAGGGDGGDGDDEAMEVDGSGEGGGGGAAAAACTTVRWHAGPVGCLAFSEDGEELLSGGVEAVLVRWRLEGGPAPMTFLPRLGGALLAAARSPADGAAFALACGDNAVRVVSTATMEVLAAVQGLRPAVVGGAAALGSGAAGGYPSDTFELRAPLAWDARARAAVLSAPHASLQLVDPSRGVHVGELRVACRAPASAAAPRAASAKAAKRAAALAAEEEEALQDVRVSLMAVAPDASSLATVEVRPAVGTARNEYCLKLWHRREGAEASGWELATRVDGPHRRRVTGLAFHPGSRMALSTSKDGTLKVWEGGAAPRSGGGAALPAWGCRASLSHRGEPVGCGAFSHDGSLVAAGAGSAVALWNVEDAAPRGALVAAPAERARAVVQLAFVKDTPFLAAAEAKGGRLIVYDLLTRSVWWSYALDVVALAPAPHAPLLAVAVAGSEGSNDGNAHGHILLMDASSGAPAKAWRCARAPPSALCYAPPVVREMGAAEADAPCALLALLASREMVVLGDPDGEGEGLLAAAEGAADADMADAEGALDRLLGASAARKPAATALFENEEEVGEVRGASELASALRTGIAADVRDTPSHALPPLGGVALRALQRALGLPEP